MEDNKSRFGEGSRVQVVGDGATRGAVVALGIDDREPIVLVAWDTQNGESDEQWVPTRLLEAEETQHDELEARLQDVSIELAKTSNDQGFVPASWNTIPTYLMFVVTELQEAWDAPDRDALTEEVADIAIRLLVVLRNIWGDVWELLDSPLATNEREGIALTVELMRVSRYLSRAARHWREGYTKATKDKIRREVESALAEVVAMATAREIDLLGAVAEKNAKNAKRPYLNGHAEAIG